MHFTTVATVAAMAVVASASAEPKPYMLAAVPGLSLMRRDTNGYTPEEAKCGAGDTCAQACGSDFTQCPSNDNVAHCFNPAAKQNCCTDGSGNSCDEGYYCTHDTALKTWCCPDGLDLAACAAAFTVTGGLVQATSSTVVSTSSTPSPTPTTVTEVDDVTTTVCPSTSAGHTSAWVPSNSTIVAPTMPATPTPPVSVPTGTSGAAATGISALLVVAAGFVALL